MILVTQQIKSTYKAKGNFEANEIESLIVSKTKIYYLFVQQLSIKFVKTVQAENHLLLDKAAPS